MHVKVVLRERRSIELSYFCRFMCQERLNTHTWMCQNTSLWKYLHKHSYLGLKGIVHPKMKILSFTHPQVVPNLSECLCSAEHKGRYSEECGKQSSSGAPLTSIVFFFSYYGSQWSPKTAWLQTLQNIFLCVRQNKDIQTGLELLEGE